MPNGEGFPLGSASLGSLTKKELMKSEEKTKLRGKSIERWALPKSEHLANCLLVGNYPLTVGKTICYDFT